MVTKMKKFAGNKPLVQIKRQAKAAGVAFDDYNYRKSGADYVCLGTASGTRSDGSPLIRVLGPQPFGAFVMYNTFNGTFFGATHEGVPFDSSSTKHEKEPWFQALLSFFYVEATDPPKTRAPRKATAVDYVLGGVALLDLEKGSTAEATARGRKASATSALEEALEPLREAYAKLPAPHRCAFEVWVLSVLRRKK